MTGNHPEDNEIRFCTGEISEIVLCYTSEKIWLVL